ncbi:MAG TPA: TlpA disulfide reductase family protein [Candidatus Poseidoniia archaeon]|nr:TlpA disulfide reductase family protein [Candidatus Poseidoniia archaeon]
MASKRRRKLERKASRSVDQKMQARRDNFSENLWRFGPPVLVLLILLVAIFFVFIYEPGNPRPEEWTLEEAETGVIYSSKDYYDGDQLTLVEFFQSQCGHCQNQAPVLKEINGNYSSQINMFSIGGYKVGSNTDSKSNVASFKFQYHNSQWPHLYDSTGDLMRDYKFNSYPSVVLVKNNEIVYQHSGGLTYDQLSAEIDKHL